MKESTAQLVVKEMKAAGIRLVAYLPDSALCAIHLLTREDPYFQLVPVTNEGEGVAVAAGAWLGGKKAIMIMESSGLRVASEALARLGMQLTIPALLLMSYRGSLGDGNWWAINQGLVLEPMLQALRIPYCIIDKEEDIEGTLQRAVRTLEASKYHVAVIMSGGTLW